MSKRKSNHEVYSSARRRAKSENEDGERTVIDICELSSHDDDDDDENDDILVIDGKKSESTRIMANMNSNLTASSALGGHNTAAATTTVRTSSEITESTSSTSSTLASTSSSSARAKTTKKEKKSKFKIFCDLDGVLVDFDRGVCEIFNMDKARTASSIPPHVLWRKIHSTPKFFRNLKLTKDGLELWETLLLRHNGRLSILTGCPTDKMSKFHKFEWCQQHLNGNKNTGTKIKFVHVDKAAKKSKHELVIHSHRHGSGSGEDQARLLGMKSISSMFRAQTKNPTVTSTSTSSSSSSSSSSIPSTTSTKIMQQKVIQQQSHVQNKVIDVITCWSKNKHYESKKNHVLIDDRIKLRDDWVRQGGIFIHHTHTKDTIQKLVHQGIIHLQL